MCSSCELPEATDGICLLKVSALKCCSLVCLHGTKCHEIMHMRTCAYWLQGYLKIDKQLKILRGLTVSPSGKQTYPWANLKPTSGFSPVRPKAASLRFAFIKSLARLQTCPSVSMRTLGNVFSRQTLRTFNCLSQPHLLAKGYAWPTIIPFL